MKQLGGQEPRQRGTMLDHQTLERLIAGLLLGARQTATGPAIRLAEVALRGVHPVEMKDFPVGRVNDKEVGECAEAAALSWQAFLAMWWSPMGRYSPANSRETGQLNPGNSGDSRTSVSNSVAASCSTACSRR